MADKEHNEQQHQKDPEKLLTVSSDGVEGNGGLSGGAEPAIPDQIDDFKILEKIGEGGMGKVYRAYEKRLERVVALKILRPEIANNPSVAKRFRREAILAANLSHPNIVPVYHVDNRDKPRYFTMEFVQGRSLKAKVEEEGFLSPAEAVRICIQACDALDYAHKHNIIHRDIKPANILLQNHIERVRITDFGIAQDISGSLVEVTQTEGLTFGTPAFMSPEQNLGEKVDHRTDIFSLGTTLYYMLTATPPFRARNRQELALAFKQQTPAPPSRFNRDVGEKLDAIVLKMLAVDIDHRYGDFSGVIADLSRLRECGPSDRGTVRGSVARLCRNCSRYLVPVAIGVLLLGLVMAGIWGTLTRVAKQPGRPTEPPITNRLRKIREISMPGVISNWAGAQIGDWDGDGEFDMFVSNSTDLLVISGQGEVLTQQRIIGDSATSLVPGLIVDMDGNKQDELFLSWTEGKNLIISLRNQHLHEMKRFVAKGSIYNGTSGINLTSGLKAELLTDLHGQGRQLIAIINTGYGCKPRGICCFDLKDEALLWQYDTGGIPICALAWNVGKEEEPGIVFSTSSVGNGNKAADGTDDNSSYVIAVSREGKHLWHYRMGGYSTFANLTLVDLAGDGRKQLLAWTRGDPDWHKGSCPVVLLTSTGTVKFRYDPDAQVTGCVVGDIDGDDKPEIILTDWRGFIHVLGPDLRLKTKQQLVQSRHGDVDLCVAAIHDLTGDGKKEIILSSSDREFVSGRNPGHASRSRSVRFYHDNSVMILDGTLRMLGKQVINPKWKRHFRIVVTIQHLAGASNPDLLVLADRAIVLRLDK